MPEQVDLRQSWAERIDSLRDDLQFDNTDEGRCWEICYALYTIAHQLAIMNDRNARIDADRNITINTR
jgi:hypothetical protein